MVVSRGQTAFSPSQRLSIRDYKRLLRKRVWSRINEPYPKLRHRHKNGRCSVGTFVKFVWATMGRKILNGNISAKKENIEL